MVRSDLGSSGVMFTLDTESGFRDVVFITSSYGLGELLVQGAVNPDEFYVHKPMLEKGRPAIVRRGLGSKLHKMVFEAAAGCRPGWWTSARRSAAFSLKDTEPGAGALRRCDREALRPADGHRMGEGRSRRPHLRAAGPP